jgi:hypothetical protein
MVSAFRFPAKHRYSDARVPPAGRLPKQMPNFGVEPAQVT